MCVCECVGVHVCWATSAGEILPSSNLHQLVPDGLLRTGPQDLPLSGNLPGKPTEGLRLPTWAWLRAKFSSVQSLSCVWLCDPVDYYTPGFPVYCQLPELAQTQVHRVSDAIQPSHPLSSPSPPAFNPSQHQGPFQWVSSSHQWPKYWSFSFSISPSNEYSGLISFRINCFNLLAVQSILESSPTPQFKSISSSGLNFLYGPTLTSIHDYWKNHSFD